MALIELNLEKPALKRVESVEEKHVEDEQIEATTPETIDQVAGDTGEDTEMESETDDGSTGKSRTRRYGRRLAILGGTAAGVAAARKLRQRRQSGAEQQDLEEDWQTAE